MASKKIKPPKGTRDLYPEDVLRQRYITNAWRDASIRCGFEEIAGPTFESTDLYAVKSGDGILGELFQAFSGKGGSETLDKLVEKGKADFALRPEFTPTLARMYAAKSKELPKPCKWFTAGPYFRAERPQRGRLREFLQWNVDAIGLPGEDSTPESKFQMDSEVIECCLRMFEIMGMGSNSVSLHINNREIVDRIIKSSIKPNANIEAVYAALDKRQKFGPDAFEILAEKAGLDILNFDRKFKIIEGQTKLEFKGALMGAVSSSVEESLESTKSKSTYQNVMIARLLRKLGFSDWYQYDASIVRGLAYYTGTVFEALADGERAVAGGGRYDNLIELFGGPPTPACGFGMGDVVLGNLLDDKELMPSGTELMEAVARPQASIRPEAFIVPNGDEDNESLVHTLTANLRRGIESESWLANDSRKPWNKERYTVAPMHARISYKSTRKINKLRDDAAKQHAKFFIVINDDENNPANADLQSLDTRESLGSFSTDPSNPNYIGREIAKHL